MEGRRGRGRGRVTAREEEEEEEGEDVAIGGVEYIVCFSVLSKGGRGFGTDKNALTLRQPRL